MADDLGSAVLRITVDDSAARQSLQSLRQEIQRSTRAGGVGGGRARGGARENILTLERAQNRRFQIAQRIERLEERGANVSRLRARLGDATTALAQRQFGTFRQITNELQRQVKLSEARAAREDRIAQALARQARVGGPRESILGRRGLTGSPADLAFLARQGGPRSPIGGAVDIPGSPAFLAAQRRFVAQELSRSAAIGGPRSPIGGSLTIPGSPAFLAAQRRFTAQELSRAAAIGGPRSPIGGTPLLAGSPAAIRAEERLAQARQRATQAAEKATQAEGRRIGRLNVSPVRGGAAFPGSPAFLDAALPPLPSGYFQQQQRRIQEEEKRRAQFENRLAAVQKASFRRQEQQASQAAKRTGDIASNALIGGAFPLLFGQGAGASAGGLLGGAAGGALGGGFGFGLSLIGTAVGAQFDALTNQAKALAEALRDPIASFDQLKTSAALSSRGLEAYIEALIRTGQTAKAEQLIRRDLSQNINPTTASALSAANDELARSFSDVQEKLSNILAGPSIAFLQWLDEILDRLPIQGPGGARAGQLPSAAQARALTEQGRNNQLIGLALGAQAIGTIGAGAALTATGVGAPAGLAALVYGLTAASAAFTLGGRGQQAQGQQAQEDRRVQEATKGIQEELAAVQARRIALQKQLVGFTGDEKSAAAQIAQGQEQALRFREAQLKAARDLAGVPLSASTEEFNKALEAARQGIAGAKEELDKFIAAQNNSARLAKRDTDIRERTTGLAPSARRGVELTEALNRAREGYDKAKAATEAAVGEEAQRAAQAVENNLGQAWRSARQDVADYNAELAFTIQRQSQDNALALAAVRERISSAQALAAAPTGPIRDTLQTRQQVASEITAARNRVLNLGDQIGAARLRGDEVEATRLVGEQKVAAQQTQLALIQGGDALSAAGIDLQKRALDVKNQLQNLRIANFETFLSPEEQQLTFERALRAASAEAQRAGVSFSTTGSLAERTRQLQAFADFRRAERGLTEEGAQLEAAILLGNAPLLRTNEGLIETNAVLTDSVLALVDKNWDVTVVINNNGGAQALGDVNGALG